MSTVTVRVKPHSDASARLLFPKSFNDGYRYCTGINLENACGKTELTADFARQRALWCRAEDCREPVSIHYHFQPSGDPLPGDFFLTQNNRYTQASAQLIEEVACLRQEADSEFTMVGCLLASAKDLFSYGHVEQRFNDGCESVPTVCGTAKGSCVDMNTYLMAAAKSLGVKVQYVAGYWFHPERNHTEDMHCWLLFELAGEIVPWDLAHHLKWGVDDLKPGLNPAGGRRVPMSFGRGLTFDSESGLVSISHFSEPVWVFPDGEWQKARVEISICDEE